MTPLESNLYSVWTQKQDFINAKLLLDIKNPSKKARTFLAFHYKIMKNVQDEDKSSGQAFGYILSFPHYSLPFHVQFVSFHFSFYLYALVLIVLVNTCSSSSSPIKVFKYNFIIGNIS